MSHKIKLVFIWILPALTPIPPVVMALARVLVQEAGLVKFDFFKHSMRLNSELTLNLTSFLAGLCLLPPLRCWTWNIYLTFSFISSLTRSTSKLISQLTDGILLQFI